MRGLGFTAGMNGLDYRSMVRGQKAIAAKNEQQHQEFSDRFDAAIAEQESCCTVKTIKGFCELYGFSKRTLYKPHNANRLAHVKKLPLKKAGNPNASESSDYFCQSVRWAINEERLHRAVDTVQQFCEEYVIASSTLYLSTHADLLTEVRQLIGER